MLNTNLNNVGYNPSQGDVKTTLFYINDLHGRLKGAHKYKVASDSFDAKYKNSGIDVIKLSAGDIMIGPDKNRNAFFSLLLNMMKIDSAVLGNHDLELTSNPLSKVMDKINFKYVVSNMKFATNTPLEDDIEAKRLVKSTILNKNGHRYGIVGALAPDAKLRIGPSAQNGTKDILLDSMENTIKDLQEQVNKLKEQGINKIIMISHLGNSRDIQVAKNTQGIDVIVGGHSHSVIEGVTKDQNYLNGKDGSPILITQAGRDGKYYGISDIVFNKNGIIKDVQNHLNSTQNTPKSLITKFFEERYMGKAKEIGRLVKTVDSIPEEKGIESPLAMLAAEGIRKQTGADISFFNMGGVKGSLDKGILTERSIKELIPYENKLSTYKLSEKNVIDIIKGGIKSSVTEPKRPSIIQASGLRYTVDKNKNLKDVYFENKDGSLTKIDPNNPSPEKKYNVTYNDYLARGLKFLETMNCPEKKIKDYDFTDTQALTSYIKTFGNQPLEIKAQGKIIVE